MARRTGRGRKERTASKAKNPPRGRNNEKRRSYGGEHKRSKNARSRCSNSQRHCPKLRKLEPVAPPVASSIHKHWKKDLGGLIRYYVNVNGMQNSDDVDAIYLANGCSIEQTRDAMLRALAQDPVNAKPHGEEWINLSMIVEPGEGVPEGDNTLKVVERPGEGPAFSSETWRNVVVPSWAVDKSFYFEVQNRTNVDLSCEMTIDGHKAAYNAPIPALSRRTIRPDVVRNFETHKWLLKPSKRIKLNQLLQRNSHRQTELQQTHQTPVQQRSSGQRYNGRSPDYQGKRISLVDYPSPSDHGWTFTGSNQRSCVEFYEKKLNLGIVKLDFYYTTGTVKTVLDHPTTGLNQLFRNRVTPQAYQQILLNPRSHTNVGYRTRNQIPADDAEMEDVETGEVESQDETGTSENSDAMDDNSEGVNDPVYFAKNEEYNFEEEGHANRKAAVAELKPTQEYRAWEDAARTRYACIHAKFFASTAQWMRKEGGRGRRAALELQELPEMSPVMDVKATDHAVLSTKFESMGPSLPRGRSNVRIKRISGLTDDPEWGSGPVFEYKLYYRAEWALDPEKNNDFEEDMDGDEMDEDEDELSGKLRQETPLDEYKAEKLAQVSKLHQDIVLVADQEEANVTLNDCNDGIALAEDSDAVDRFVKTYLDWNQKHVLNSAGRVVDV